MESTDTDDGARADVSAAIVRLIRCAELILSDTHFYLQKLHRKVRAETMFLTRALASQDLNPAYSNCSNLHHLDAVYRCVSLEKDVIGVMETFTHPVHSAMSSTLASSASSSSTSLLNVTAAISKVPAPRRSHGSWRQNRHSIEVDVVADHGAKWIKVKTQSAWAARNVRPPDIGLVRGSV
jgi:hypothetical protein